MSVLKRRHQQAFTHAQKQGPKKIARNVTLMDVVPSRQSSTNQQAIRIGGWANPTRGGELKFIDTQITTNPVVNSITFATGVLLNGIANGSDASTRIGRKVTIKSLLLRWSVKLDPTTTGGGNLRILIVYDKQANAVAPAITDILLTNDFHSPNNLSNRDRFVTICDVVTDPIAVQGEYSAADVVYKKLNLEEMFNAGSAGTIGDITSGSIYFFVAQNGGMLIAAPDFRADARIRYTDV